jgi:hypothetical protein
LNVSADFLLGLRDEPDRGGRSHVSLPTPRQERQKHILRPTPATVSVTAVAPTMWLTSSFAREWFEEALHEARTGRDHHARRREIVFAVCFAESYLLEWVRDEVLKGDFPRFDRYFVPGTWESVVEKWQDIPKKLLADGLIAAAPNLGEAYWEEWRTLVTYRNGLVHARASRPESGSQPEAKHPMPSKGDLDQLVAGWAVRIVVTLVRRLHDAVGTSPPAWLVES